MADFRECDQESRQLDGIKHFLLLLLSFYVSCRMNSSIVKLFGQLNCCNSYLKLMLNESLNPEGDAVLQFEYLNLFSQLDSVLP